MANDVEIYIKKTGFRNPDLLEELNNYSTVVDFLEGEFFLRPKTYITKVAILIEGLVKISKLSDDDKQILLYYIEPGRSCPMSIASALNNELSAIEGRAVKPSKMLLVPIERMNQWMIYPEWRNFIIGSLVEAYQNVTDIFSQLAFDNLEKRIHHFLKRRSSYLSSTTLQMSHNDIANELGTSREVVSRILKKMESNKTLKLGNKEIKLLRKD